MRAIVLGMRLRSATQPDRLSCGHVEFFRAVVPRFPIEALPRLARAGEEAVSPPLTLAHRLAAAFTAVVAFTVLVAAITVAVAVASTVAVAVASTVAVAVAVDTVKPERCQPRVVSLLVDVG